MAIDFLASAAERTLVFRSLQAKQADEILVGTPPRSDLVTRSSRGGEFLRGAGNRVLIGPVNSASPCTCMAAMELGRLRE